MIYCDFRDCIINDELSFVYFGSKNCPSCKKVEIILKEMEAVGAKIYASPKDAEIYASYSVDVIPTVIVFTKDIIYDILIGLRPKNDYLSFLGNEINDSCYYI